MKDFHQWVVDMAGSIEDTSTVKDEKEAEPLSEANYSQEDYDYYSEIKALEDAYENNKYVWTPIIIGD